MPATPAKLDAFCKEMGRLTDTRLTVIRPDGIVLGDTDSTPATMENHAGRPEIQEALGSPGKIGTAVRESPTLGMTIYYSIHAAAILQGMWWWWGVPILVLIFLFTGLFQIAIGLDEIANPRLRGAKAQ